MEQERLILFIADTGEDSNFDAERSLSELSLLISTAGAKTVGTMIQKRDSIHPASYLGTGKIKELKEMIYELDATGVVCDDELSPGQMKNLEDELDIKVMDRTIVILDIFAKRATTAEGKIQVELAQLKYRLTRLAGYGTKMSRLGGGIGTRGPGETKLESDRRVVRNRVNKLNSELKEIVKHRDVTRQKRGRNKMPVIAIVGYTNAGKSTLLNLLTGSEVLSMDQLFATLDPTTRNYRLPSGEEVLLTDTVGFINKLPHHLVDAFRSTLEEAKYADIILHVVDGSNENYDKQMEVVYETLYNLKITEKPVITLFNKMDDPNFIKTIKDIKATKTVYASAKTKEGIEDLNIAIQDIIREGKILFEGIIPFSEGNKLNLVRSYGELISEEYVNEGIKIKAYIPNSLEGKL